MIRYRKPAMTPNRAVRSRSGVRRRRLAVAAGLAASAVIGGLTAEGASAAPGQAPPTLRELPPFWDVGIGQVQNLVDGQQIRMFAAARPHEGGVSALMCSGPFGAPGVICEPAGGPFFERDGFITFDVRVKAVITDARTGRRVDCRVQNTCHVALVPAGLPGDAYSQAVTFVPAPPRPPSTAAPGPAATSTTTTPPSSARPAPVKATPQFTG
jgi:hypothetical protein